MSFAPNVGMFRPRQTLASFRPKTVEDVQDFVRTSTAVAGPPLHAVSTGRNWGLGSREPARDGVVTVDLGGLDRIRAIDLDGGWAVIEPGVTQRQLADRLAGTSRMLNVTGSSGHTSVLGNILDRGVGLRRQRTADLAGLEVVLPDGRLVRVGWWPAPDGSPRAVNADGLGPSPLGLFTQSDLGIATAAVVRLLPRPEALRLLRLDFDRDRLVPAIDALRRWSAQGLFRGVLKVYDTVSGDAYGGAAGGYSAYLCVDGTAPAVDALSGVIEQEADGSGCFHAVTRADDAADLVSRALRGVYAGDPTLNEEVLRAALGQDAERVDAEGTGWIFFLPFVPFTGADVHRALGLLDRVHAETGIRPGATVNALDSDVIDLVVSLRFPRTDADSARAHRALDLLYELFAEAGYPPYRLDVDHHAWVDRFSPDPAARAFVRRLKQFLDPNGVIADGRYA